MTEHTGDVLFERRGGLGLITLNRPRVINALTLEMIRAIQLQLDDWATDDDVRTVAIRGAGERGLCAGGDVAVLARAFLQGERESATSMAREFFQAEYRLNRAIARYPKPYVALMDGVVLGGGVGVSAHGSHRLVTERSRIGMPETAIGLFPDVGATWLLAQSPGGLGGWMALTGVPVDGATAIHAGFADALVPSAQLDALLLALESSDVDEAIRDVAEHRATTADTPTSQASQAQSPIAEDEWMGALRDAASLEKALAEMRAVAAGTSPSSDAATEALAVIETRSPTSLRVTFEALQRARQLPSLEAALATEYRLALRMTAGHDFAEGVRAQLLDKDRSPAWQPATLEDVDDAAVETVFAPLAAEEGPELSFATPPGDVPRSHPASNPHLASDPHPTPTEHT